MIAGATGWRKGTDQDDGGYRTKQLCTHENHQDINHRMPGVRDDIRMGEVKDDGLEEIRLVCSKQKT